MVALFDDLELKTKVRCKVVFVDLIGDTKDQSKDCNSSFEVLWIIIGIVVHDLIAKIKTIPESFVKFFFFSKNLVKVDINLFYTVLKSLFLSLNLRKVCIKFNLI